MLWRGLIIVVLSTLLGGANLIYLGNADAPLPESTMWLRYKIVGGCAGLLILLSRFQRPRLNKTSSSFVCFWFLFGASIFISGIVNTEAAALRDGVWYMFGIPLLCFTFLPALMGDSANLILAISTHLGIIPFIIVSLIEVPITTSMYMGIFANPNQMGITCGLLSMATLVLLSGAIRTNSSNLIVAPLLLLWLGETALVVVSNSRTTWVISALLLAMALKHSMTKRQVVYLMGLTVFASVAISLMVASGHFSNLIDVVKETYERKQENEGASGRTEIWEGTLRDAELFGRGYDYFSKNHEFSAHNSFFETLGRSGIVSTVLMIIMSYWTLVRAWQYSKTFSHDRFSHFPFYMTTFFWGISLAEGMFGALGNGATFAFLVATGIVVGDQSKTQTLPGRHVVQWQANRRRSNSALTKPRSRPVRAARTA